MVTNGAASMPPSELILEITGNLVARGSLSFVPSVALAALGNLIGTTGLFLAARKWGRALVRRIPRFTPFSSVAVLDRIERLFHVHGDLLVLVGRWIPNIRSLISVPAGVGTLSVRRFFVYTSAGVTTWALLWIVVGYAAGPGVTHVIDSTGSVALIVTLLLLVVFSFWLHRPPEHPQRELFLFDRSPSRAYHTSSNGLTAHPISEAAHQW